MGGLGQATAIIFLRQASIAESSTSLPHLQLPFATQVYMTLELTEALGESVLIRRI